MRPSIPCSTNFDGDGLLRRHDNVPEALGRGPAARPDAHYISEYREFDGIMVPTRRRVYPVDADGHAAEEPLLVTIDLDRIKFS